MSAHTLPSTARTWRASLPAPDRRHLSDALIGVVDRLPRPVRDSVVRQLDRALRAGVVDPGTLAAIVECVTSARDAA